MSVAANDPPKITIAAFHTNPPNADNVPGEQPKQFPRVGPRLAPLRGGKG
jgi:hypothetical protein